jgi:hypothetical protein
MGLRQIALARVGSFLLLGVCGPVCAAEVRESEFQVVCAELSLEAAAEVEARSRVEAQLSTVGGLGVQLSCNEHELTVRLESKEPGTPRVHVVTSARGTVPVADALVGLFVHALETFPVDAPAPSPSDVPSSGDAPSPAGSEGDGQLESAAPLPAEKATLATRPRRLEAEAKPKLVKGEGPRILARRFNVDALGTYESLGSEATGAFGFGTNGFMALTERVRIGLTGRVGAGVGAQDLEILAVNVGLGGELRLTNNFWAAVAPEVSLHNYRVTGPTRAQGSDVVLGISLGAGVLWGGDLALRSGVALELYTHERIVRVDGNEVFRVPMATVALHLGGRFQFGPVVGMRK